MKEDYYYLFGEDVVTSYNEGGLDDVVKAIQNGAQFNMYHYSRYESTPSDLLYEYDGYWEFAEIDKLEYETLLKSINEV
jgi:hypothetical protein